MAAACALAARGLGSVWPSPSVGCVIVGSNGRVAGRGWTAPGGRPHAEARALAMAGAAARGGTAYVTLEPCAHQGRGPPCADALIAAGIARVVVALGDPDPRTDGQGLARLRAAGIAVEIGLMAEAAADLAAGFMLRITRGRPLVTLKLATTLDGRIATATGESQWITGDAARREAHALRGRHDAVLVGIGTVLADDPALTCRIDGFRAAPVVRVVVDRRLRTPLTSVLARTALDAPTWILHGADADTHADTHADAVADPGRRDALAAAGVRLIPVAAGEGGIDMHAALAALGAAGLTRVLAEGGAGVAAALLRAGLVDRVAWFHAPAVIGGDGRPAVVGLGVASLAMAPRFVRHSARRLGADMLTEFRSGGD
jgi:diaminohydroxyphosphoribosylaminopyrimidine deaminase/5-amino-6-(5-phosphoribosylamino)uracil reductase